MNGPGNRNFNPWRIFRASNEDGQLVLAGGVAMAFAILIIAGLSQLGTEMDADRDIEPYLGPEFIHLRDQFEKAVAYQYNRTNDSAEETFANTSRLFVNLELHYGVLLEFTLLNTTGSQGNETIAYRIEMMSTEQLLKQEGTLVLRR